MPDTEPISDLPAMVLDVDDVADLIPATDVSDTSSAASGTTKKYTPAQIRGKAAANSWTGQQYFATATLVDGASIDWDLNTQEVAKVTIAGNRTLANPTNMKDGGTYILRVIQGAGGSRLLAYGANYKWPGGTAPTLSTAVGAVDIICFHSDGVNLYGVAQTGFS